MSIASVGFSPMPLTVDYRSAVRQSDAASKPKPQKIRIATEEVQRISNAFSKRLQFVVDQNSNQVIVKVIDKDTDKVIRELPPEELQRLHGNLKEAMGLLFDKMV